MGGRTPHASTRPHSAEEALTTHWTTIHILKAPDRNLAVAVRVLPLDQGPRYQVHLGRLNREEAFSPGAPVVPEREDDHLVIADLLAQARKIVQGLREKRDR